VASIHLSAPEVTDIEAYPQSDPLGDAVPPDPLDVALGVVREHTPRPPRRCGSGGHEGAYPQTP
jgi:hypothetical protein